MNKNKGLKSFFLCLCFCAFFFNDIFAADKKIAHLVVFGDSLSDKGSSEYGGFNRYSNGPVWAEYLSEALPRGALEDYAWGGAKTDRSNVHDLKWSGLLWQIDHYHPQKKADGTVYVIWAGANDLMNGKGEPLQSVENIKVAINRLVSIGAKEIFIFNLPDLTLLPPYHNSAVPQYPLFFPVKDKVKSDINRFNSDLTQCVKAMQNGKKLKFAHVNLYVLDFSTWLNQVIDSHEYQNVVDPWNGTYTYPADHAYIWWDAWHPMTSVHKKMAMHIKKEFIKKGFVFN